MRHQAIVFLLVFAMLFTLGCSKKDASQATSSGKKVLKVTTTTGVITDLAKRIGGEYVEVSGLMGPGTDPHLYKARERDIRLLAQADVVFYNGLHLEGKLGAVLEKMAAKKPTIAVAESIDHKVLLKPKNLDVAHDPHVWFDVSLWMKAVDSIRDGLVMVMPEKISVFTLNAQSLLTEMQELHQWCGEQIATIPKKQRVLITAHDAFGYFGRAYGIEVRGIQGISTEDEAGVGEINDLVQFIAKRGIKAVFVESSVPKKNIEALIEGAQSKGGALKVGGELFSDAMGADKTPEGTYIGMVKHNVNTIVAALK